MDITPYNVKSVLTPQRKGFLATGPYPFTHTLSAYTGCGFGKTTCGLYCYAQFLPNWQFRGGAATWGTAVGVKQNAAQVLRQELEAMGTKRRQRLRIFMSSSTDPYQPIENQYQLSRQCLEVFANYQDLDLLVVQTRSPLVERDLPLLRTIPYAYLSMTIETDDQDYLKSLRGGPALEKRWAVVRTAHELGVKAQITVSPCLPYSSVEGFGQQLLGSGAKRVIVDSFIDGDGTHGERTARSPFATAIPDWRATEHIHRLYDYLNKHTAEYDVAIGWSSDGFSGIPSRYSSQILTEY